MVSLCKQAQNPPDLIIPEIDPAGIHSKVIN